ncbi:hypothetical protein LCGC14_0872900 [marine sediment metagenome]|uniref:Uncharacterized protein n=1 Tax=marine sediment metagenome TaxID=412755 RepID=A0A0F9RNT9_9ZZZZ
MDNPYCHNSPTKRHHWLLEGTNNDVTAAICKYCLKTRTFGKPYKPIKGRPIPARRLL